MKEIIGFVLVVLSVLTISGAVFSQLPNAKTIQKIMDK